VNSLTLNIFLWGDVGYFMRPIAVFFFFKSFVFKFLILFYKKKEIIGLKEKKRKYTKKCLKNNRGAVFDF